MSSEIYKPRLCHVVRGSNGFGFHLHGEKGKYGQVIRKIESGTPAATSGLKPGDRIIAVNGKNVESCSHQEVVAIIREMSGETRLLVVDKEADEYFQENKIPITEASIQNGNGVSESVEPGTANTELRPRLCHMVKGDQGFGFNLHSDKTRRGRYIRVVEEGGPAAQSGLKPGDRVIEVNGKNMEYEKHQDVVSTVKKAGQEVELLVVDAETDRFFKSCDVTPTPEHLAGPLPTPQENPPSEPTTPSETPSAPASTPATENPPYDNGVDLMTIDLDTLKKMSRTAKKKPAPSSNWNNRQAMFNNL